MVDGAGTHRSVLSRLVGTSVGLNGVMIPAALLPTVLGRYVDNLFIYNDHDVFKVSLVGSAVPIKYSGRYFLLCTNHQLRGQKLENVSLMSRDGQKLITSSGVRHFANEESCHYLDLGAFEFSESCEAHPELKERFFELQRIPPDAPSADIIFAVVAGFPAKEQKYEIEDKNHIGKFKRIITCGLDSSSYDPALLCLRTNEPLDFDPDGMSGGSAFVVQRVGREFHAFFAGIVVTAGSDRFHIIKVGFIERFLAALVQQR